MRKAKDLLKKGSEVRLGRLSRESCSTTPEPNCVVLSAIRPNSLRPQSHLMYIYPIPELEIVLPVRIRPRAGKNAFPSRKTEDFVPQQADPGSPFPPKPSLFYSRLTSSSSPVDMRPRTSASE